jgi:hypothetical protein
VYKSAEATSPQHTRLNFERATDLEGDDDRQNSNQHPGRDLADVDETHGSVIGRRGRSDGGRSGRGGRRETLGHSGNGAAKSIVQQNSIIDVNICRWRCFKDTEETWTDLEIPVAAASEAEAATDEALAARDSEADEALALFVPP